MQQFTKTPQITIHLLKRIDAARFRLRVETLPYFLGIFSQLKMFKNDLREIIVSIIGEHGQWLASQNNDWNWAVSKLSDDLDADLSAVEIIWNEGTFTERKSALEIICQNDSAKAKKLLCETWKGEKAESRNVFLEIVSSYFDDSDVDFLEGILRERSSSVRQTAMNCLSRFQESEFAKIIRGFADQIIVTKKTAKSETLQVEPPSEFTKQMKAIGLEEKPPQGMGVKSWLVYEILKFVPFSYWEQRFQTNVLELVARLSGDEYFQSVLYAWTYAAQIFPNCDQWLEPIWDEGEKMVAKLKSDPLHIFERYELFALKKSPVRFIEKLKHKNQGRILLGDDYFMRSIWLDLVCNMSVEVEDFFVANILEYFERSKKVYDWLAEFIPFLPSQQLPKIKNILQQIRMRNEKSEPQYTSYSLCDSTLDLCEQFNCLLDKEKEVVTSKKIS
jgi:hypothetical protein